MRSVTTWMSMGLVFILAKIRDECGHGLYLYAAAETLGTSQ
jgi:1,2-phenylacetyl-CoA epoxidase catalytic subunit